MFTAVSKAQLDLGGAWLYLCALFHQVKNVQMATRALKQCRGGFLYLDLMCKEVKTILVTSQTIGK